MLHAFRSALPAARLLSSDGANIELSFLEAQTLEPNVLHVTLALAFPYVPPTLFLAHPVRHPWVKLTPGAGGQPRAALLNGTLRHWEPGVHTLAEAVLEVLAQLAAAAPDEDGQPRFLTADDCCEAPSYAAGPATEAEDPQREIEEGVAALTSDVAQLFAMPHVPKVQLDGEDAAVLRAEAARATLAALAAQPQSVGWEDDDLPSPTRAPPTASQPEFQAAPPLPPPQPPGALLSPQAHARATRFASAMANQGAPPPLTPSALHLAQLLGGPAPPALKPGATRRLDGAMDAAASAAAQVFSEIAAAPAPPPPRPQFLVPRRSRAPGGVARAAARRMAAETTEEEWGGGWGSSCAEEGGETDGAATDNRGGSIHLGDVSSDGEANTDAAAMRQGNRQPLHALGRILRPQDVATMCLLACALLVVYAAACAGAHSALRLDATGACHAALEGARAVQLPPLHAAALADDLPAMRALLLLDGGGAASRRSLLSATAALGGGARATALGLAACARSHAALALLLAAGAPPCGPGVARGRTRLTPLACALSSSRPNHTAGIASLAAGGGAAPACGPAAVQSAMGGLVPLAHAFPVGLAAGASLRALLRAAQPPLARPWRGSFAGAPRVGGAARGAVYDAAAADGDAAGGGGGGVAALLRAGAPATAGLTLHIGPLRLPGLLYDSSPLYAAAAGGGTGACEALLDAGVPPERGITLGTAGMLARLSPLAAAALGGHARAAASLAARARRPEAGLAVGPFGLALRISPLGLAARKGDVAMMATLLRQGARSDDVCGSLALGLLRVSCSSLGGPFVQPLLVAWRELEAVEAAQRVRQLVEDVTAGAALAPEPLPDSPTPQPAAPEQEAKALREEAEADAALLMRVQASIAGAKATLAALNAQEPLSLLTGVGDAAEESAARQLESARAALAAARRVAERATADVRAAAARGAAEAAQEEAQARRSAADSAAAQASSSRQEARLKALRGRQNMHPRDTQQREPFQEERQEEESHDVVLLDEL